MFEKLKFLLKSFSFSLFFLLVIILWIGFILFYTESIFDLFCYSIMFMFLVAGFLAAILDDYSCLVLLGVKKIEW